MVTLFPHRLFVVLFVGKRIFKIGIAGSNHKKGDNGVADGKGTPGEGGVVAAGWDEGSRQSRELVGRKGSAPGM